MKPILLLFLVSQALAAPPPKPQKTMHQPDLKKADEMRVADCRGGGYYKGKLTILCKTVLEEKKK